MSYGAAQPSILALSLFYTEFGHTSAISGLLYVLKAAVIALTSSGKKPPKIGPYNHSR